MQVTLNKLSIYALSIKYIIPNLHSNSLQLISQTIAELPIALIKIKRKALLRAIKMICYNVSLGSACGVTRTLIAAT